MQRTGCRRPLIANVSQIPRIGSTIEYTGSPFEDASMLPNIIFHDGTPLAWIGDVRRSWNLEKVSLCPVGQVALPIMHEDTATLEQVRARIGHLDPVLDHMRQRRLDHLTGLVRLQPFGNTGHGPLSRRRGDDLEQETG